MMGLSFNSLQPVAYGSHKIPSWPVVTAKQHKKKLNFPMWPLYEGYNSEAGLRTAYFVPQNF